MIHLHDLDDTRLDFYRNLRHAQQLHSSSNVFLTDGEKITSTVLQSPLQVQSILLTETLYLQYHALIHTTLKPDQCFIMSKQNMDELVGFNLHSPMMCIANEPKASEISSLQGPIIAMNGIVNSDNVGGIIRNAIGLGYESIITDHTTSSPYLRRAVRVSMGAVAFARCAFSSNLIKDIQEIRKTRGIPIISGEIASSSVSVTDFSFPQDFILVLGSEGYGIHDEILAISDSIVHIPMSSHLKSLNVSSSSAILLHAAKTPK
jgi:tRNA G18 (ribose-2'-O)-methylase SpoU